MVCCMDITSSGIIVDSEVKSDIVGGWGWKWGSKDVDVSWLSPKTFKQMSELSDHGTMKNLSYFTSCYTLSLADSTELD